jgi:hypothetical protein
VTTAVAKTVRVGKATGTKPRLLIATLPSADLVQAVLRNAGKLRNKDEYRQVYVSKDRTKKEQELHKVKLRSLAERKAAGEDVVLYRDNIVLRSSIPPRRSATSQ